MIIPTLVYASGNLVATGTGGQSVAWPQQRSSFYAAGLHWVFYQTNVSSKEHFITSANGVTWSNDTVLADSAGGVDFSVYFDGTYVHYVRYRSGINYRRGLPNADGTITWSATEQAVVAGTTLFYGDITVDSTGHVYISYSDNVDSIVVIRNDNTDGTWAMTVGYPQLLYTYTPASGNGASSLVSDSLGNVYAVNLLDDGTLQGTLYTGSSWGSPEAIDTGAVTVWGITQNGSVIDLVYRRSGTGVVLRERSAGVWSDEVNLSSPHSISTFATVTTLTTSGDLIVFISDYFSSIIYYKQRISGTWDAAWTTLSNETTDGLNSFSYPSTFTQPYNGRIGLVYQTRAGTPFNIKYAFLNYSTTTLSTSSAKVTSKIATMRANVSDLGSETTLTTYFEYGPTTSYGTIVAGSPTILSGTGTYSVTVTGLNLGVTYHYRAVVVGNSTAVTNGNDITFTTPPATNAAIIAGNVSIVFGVVVIIAILTGVATLVGAGLSSGVESVALVIIALVVGVIGILGVVMLMNMFPGL